MRDEAKARLRRARWAAKNPEKNRASILKYRARARDEKNRKSRERYAATDGAAARAYRKANRERLLQYMKDWRRNNLGKYNAAQAARRARKRNLAIPLTEVERLQIRAIYVEARALTEAFGEPYHVDHIKPLAKGGEHHPSNLQILRGVDNARKGWR